MGRILNMLGRHFVGNKLGKQVLHEMWRDEKILNQRVKDHKELEIEKSMSVLEDNKENFNKRDLIEIKNTIDTILDGKSKSQEIYEDLSEKQILRITKSRLRNKKLIYEDHRIVRDKIENLTNQQLYNHNYLLDKHLENVQSQNQIQNY